VLPLLLIALLAAAADPRPRPSASPREEEHLTPAARQDRAHGALEKMRGLVGQVAKIVQQAKSEKDLVKLNCAGERLSQVQGLLKVAEQAETELRAQVSRKEEDAQDHALARVSIAGRKIAQLSQDAQQCIGQLAFYNDEKTLLDVDEPKDLPRDPTNPAPPLALVSRPPPASGF
jgi:hypothetical protein